MSMEYYVSYYIRSSSQEFTYDRGLIDSCLMKQSNYENKPWTIQEVHERVAQFLGVARDKVVVLGIIENPHQLA